MAMPWLRWIIPTMNPAYRDYLETGMFPVRLDELKTNPVYNDALEGSSHDQAWTTNSRPMLPGL